MSMAAARRLEDAPSVEDILRRAQAIAAVARQQAQATEKTRRAELVAQMHAAGLLKIMELGRFGGYELGYNVFIEAVAAVGSSDGSSIARAPCISGSWRSIRSKRRIKFGASKRAIAAV